jgi:hypothetical protein
MSDAVNTAPGFARPFRSEHNVWLDQYQDAMTPIVLPASGVTISVPLLFWEVQALCLDGTADAGAVDVVLQKHGLQALEVNPANPDEPQPQSGRAHVQIWAPDYGGTTVGPIKALYGAIYVAPRRHCRHEHPDAASHLFWWWYYSNSSTNHEFKRDVWGIPNQLAAIETAYLTHTKEVRLLEDGRPALRLRLDTAAAQRIDGVETLAFQTVAQRAHDDGENPVELQDYGPIYVSPDYDFYLGKNTEVERQLDDVDFTPLTARFHGGYNGVVKMYDAKGSPRPSHTRHGDDLVDVRIPRDVYLRIWRHAVD